MKAYCVKCKAKTEMAGAVESEMNGRKAIKGKCGDCGTGMFKLISGKKETVKNPPASSSETPRTAEPRRRGPLGVRV